MALKLKRFDPAKYITSPEAEANALSQAFETGHHGYIAAALGAVARARGMTQLAEQTGLNRAALYAALSEDGNPTLDTLLRVMCALNIKLEAKEISESEECIAERNPARARTDRGTAGLACSEVCGVAKEKARR
jgi:probable addiction module antidote protein